MIHSIVEQLKNAASSSTVIGAMTSGLLGLAATGTDLIAGNGSWVIGVCAVLGAVLANLPKIISARAHAKLSESEYIGKETRGLIDMLKKSAWDSERILALSNNLRHTVQSSYQASLLHITYLESLMGDHGIKNIPKIQPLDMSQLLKEYDEQIINIKNARP